MLQGKFLGFKLVSLNALNIHILLILNLKLEQFKDSSINANLRLSAEGLAKPVKEVPVNKLILDVLG